MGKSYGHVTIEERCEISRLQTSGLSVRQIAASLDRSPSTVAREMKRNGSRTQGYQPRYADQQAHARRWRGSRLERDEVLRDTRSSPDSSRAGLPSRWRVVWLWSQAPQSSPMRVSTGSSTPRWHARRTTAGATTCPGPSPGGGGEDVKRAALPPSWPCDAPSPNAPKAPPIAVPRATGRPT